MKNLFKKISLISISVLSLIITVNSGRNSQLLMPDEYKLIKRVVNRLAKNNDLGERHIGFIIRAGGPAAYYAQEVGLCKNEYCYYFTNLDPFKKYSNKTKNDIINISYLSGPGEASASANNGTVTISRNEFRIIDNKENFLACTIGHELSHIFNFDSYENSRKVNKESQKLKDKERKELLAVYRRESEKIADIVGQNMVVRAGYNPNSCIDQMEFLMKTHVVRKLSKLDTHPPFQERINALNDSLTSQKQARIEKPIKTKLKWEYDRKVNMLKFIPIKQGNKTINSNRNY